MANDDDDGVVGFRGAVAAAVGAFFFRFVLVLLLLLLVTLLLVVVVPVMRSRCNNSSLLAGKRASLEAVLATACNADFRDRSTLVKADRTSKSCFGNGCCRLMKSSKFFCRLDFP